MSRCSLSVCPVILMWAYSMSSGTEVPHWRFSMIRIYLQWQELAWDSKSSSMRFGYSYFMGHEVFNLWFVKHMLHNCTRINFNHSRCLWWGQWELKASKYHNFWRFIKLAITVTRVNSTNVLDEGLRIGETGCRMNSKVKSVKQGVYRK
jgi:hypothetical protein